MTRQSGNYVDADHLRPRYLAGNDGAIAATGVVLSAAVALQAGDVVSNITFITGGTAAGTPRAGFGALYSSASTPALLAQTADFGSTARAANTAYTVALATAQTITTAGIYYVAISFTATTVPTLRGVTVGNAAVAGATACQRRCWCSRTARPSAPPHRRPSPRQAPRRLSRTWRSPSRGGRRCA